MWQLPFVFIRVEHGIYLVNIKTCAKPQLIVQAKIWKQGFCISSGQDSFDFHFAHILTEDDKSSYEVHSRFCFRSDLSKFLKENGKLPPFDLDGVTKLMKRERVLVKKQKEMSKENEKLIEEIKMLKAVQSGCCQLF